MIIVRFRTLLAAACLLIMGGGASAFQNSQHAAITQSATNAAAPNYPDIGKFGALITSWSWGERIYGDLVIVGNPSEELAHALKQNASEAEISASNGGDFAQIIENINIRYKQGKFSAQNSGQEGAYVWMGSAIHLIEDQASPLHATNILHSLSDKFEGSSIGLTGDNTASFGLKQKPFPFSTNQGAATAFDQAYTASLNITKSKVLFWRTPTDSVRMWLFNDEARNILSFANRLTKSPVRYPEADPGGNGSQTGEHGGIGLGQQHVDPTLFTDSPADLYSEPDGPSIFTIQSSQGSDYAYNFLIKISESLPPLVNQLEIVGAGAPAIINSQSGSDISFFVSDNRSHSVQVALFIKEAPLKKIVTDAGVLTLSDIGNPLGDIQSRNLTGVQTWDNNLQALFQTNPTNLDVLPYKTQFHLTWKGVVAGGDGAPLADGNYTLCLNVRDGDEHDSSSADDLCDTSVHLTTSPVSFSTRAA